jgi:hypothetical protein
MAGPVITAVHVSDPAEIHQLFFPPFAKLPRAANITPFQNYTASRIHRIGHRLVDSHGLAGVPEGSCAPSTSSSARNEEQLRDKKLRQLQKAKLGVRLVREDCFKLGTVPGWIEPEGTSRSDYSRYVGSRRRVDKQAHPALHSA